MSDVLRPYQERAITEVRARVAEGHKRVLLVAPTGAGKGTMAAHLVESSRALGKRSLFLAHRRELLRQVHDRVPWAGIVAAKHPSVDSLCQIASIQTLARREKPEAELVVVDESHHVPSASWSGVLQHYPDAVVVGLTATPIRADRKGLGDYFTTIVEAARPSQLFADGFLSPFEAFAFDAPELHDVKIRAGDFDAKALALASNTSVLVGNAARAYRTYAPGRRAIAFAVNIEHSLRLRDEFRADGWRAEHVDGDTPEEERADALARFAAGDVDVIVNVALFTEGLDIPAAEVCIMCRPTLSESMCLQQVGRVLRPFPGKRALIMDCAGNLLRHGLPNEDREWQLVSTPKRVRDVNTCPLCRAVFGSIRDDGSCPKCGEIIAPPREVREEQARKEKERIEGERIEAERIRELRRQHAANVPTEQKRAYYDRLVAQAAGKKYRAGWVFIRFKLAFGHAPNFGKVA